MQKKSVLFYMLFTFIIGVGVVHFCVLFTRTDYSIDNLSQCLHFSIVDLEIFSNDAVQPADKYGHSNNNANMKFLETDHSNRKHSF